MEKLCPIVLRRNQREILAFRHPLAGIQLVKGTRDPNEAPRDGAVRELFEESGIVLNSPPVALGTHVLAAQIWHFFQCHAEGLPENWEHRCADDGGHVFAFFWHRLEDELTSAWHPLFHDVMARARHLIA